MQPGLKLFVWTNCCLNCNDGGIAFALAHNVEEAVEEVLKVNPYSRSSLPITEGGPKFGTQLHIHESPIGYANSNEG